MKSVHLVGCLGTGMAALAWLYAGVGVRVTGCDDRVGERNARAAGERLGRLGVRLTDRARCRGGVEAGTAGPELLVHTLAVPGDDSELAGARARGVRVATRVEALADLLTTIADTVVAVSGVTGKTTVAGFVAELYRELGTSPAVYIGGDVDGLTDRPHRAHGDRLAVVEACEVRGGMLRLPATVSAVTSVYWGEHPTSYPTPASLEEAFAGFVGAAPRAVLPERHRRLARGHDVVTFGTSEGADVRLTAYRSAPAGFGARFLIGGRDIEAVTRLRGWHNAENLAAALACHVAAGTPVRRLAELDLRRLRAPHRRIEPVGGTSFYDDFGHNPPQIAAAHEVLRDRHPEGPLGAYLQPASFERLHAFGIRRFAEELQRFDRVYVAPSPYLRGHRVHGGRVRVLRPARRGVAAPWGEGRHRVPVTGRRAGARGVRGIVHVRDPAGDRGAQKPPRRTRRVDTAGPPAGGPGPLPVNPDRTRRSPSRVAPRGLRPRMQGRTSRADR
jgi:UDP-N-acetylmuramate-alanine ligase